MMGVSAGDLGRVSLLCLRSVLFLSYFDEEIVALVLRFWPVFGCVPHQFVFCKFFLHIYGVCKECHDGLDLNCWQFTLMESYAVVLQRLTFATYWDLIVIYMYLFPCILSLTFIYNCAILVWLIESLWAWCRMKSVSLWKWKLF